MRLKPVTWRRLFLLNVFLFLCASAFPQLSQAQEKVVIAIQPTLSSDEMLKKAKPLEKFIPERYRQAHRQHVEEFGKTGSTSRAMAPTVSSMGTAGSTRCW